MKTKHKGRPDRTAASTAAPSPTGPSATLPPTQRPSPQTKPTLEMVRERAYHKWVEAGSPPGDGKEFWEQAEVELNGMSGEWVNTNGGGRSVGG
jgi:hypothetical protein